MRARLLTALLALPALTACQDRQARAENAELRGRVAALEAEVRTLQSAAEEALPADEVEVQAAAQNCATALARALETYRQAGVDGRYPPVSRVSLPDACAGQRVNWLKLAPGAYTFTVTGDGGRELARQSGGE